jgi:hypothetical protein
MKMAHRGGLRSQLLLEMTRNFARIQSDIKNEPHLPFEFPLKSDVQAGRDRMAGELRGF